MERLRARWRRTRLGLDPRRLTVVDESSVHLALTRLYARAPRGVRAIGSVPQNYGQNLTVLGALHHRGIRAAMLLPGATDGEVFRTFVERVRLPELKRGDTVVWDNLAAHKVAGVAELLQTAGVSLYYLPPYSPDYNPMEPAWSKIKTLLRAAGARTQAHLQRALERALTQVSTQDSRAWFKHCGYPLH